MPKNRIDQFAQGKRLSGELREKQFKDARDTIGHEVFDEAQTNLVKWWREERKNYLKDRR